MHHRRILPTLSLLLFTACGAWTPQPAAATDSSTSGSSSSSGDVVASTEPTTWPTPPDWGSGLPDLGSPDPGTTFGTGSGGPVLTDTGPGEPPIDLTALRLSEILADPDGKDGGAASPEFIEIAHVGAAALPLAGLVISARGWPELWTGDLGISGEILEPGERLVVERYASAADLPIPPIAHVDGTLRVAFADSGGLRNDDGAVALRDQDGALGDTILYGALQPAPFDDPAMWTGAPTLVPPSGESLCRPDLGVDSDTASDWSACAPTPGELPAVTDDTTGETTGEPAPALVAIVEVLSNPVGPASLEKHAEFVEIDNLGPGPIDLAGFTIADSVDPDAPGIDPLLYFGGDGGCAPTTCLAPGRKALVVGSLYEGPVGDALVLKTDDTAIANAGLGTTEPVVLRDAEGEVRSTYRAWPDPLAAPDPASQEEALVRTAAGAEDVPDSWAFAAPTPGL